MPKRKNPENPSMISKLTGATRKYKSPEQAWNESKTHQYYRSTVGGGNATAKRQVSRSNSGDSIVRDTIIKALRRGR